MAGYAGVLCLHGVGSRGLPVGVDVPGHRGVGIAAFMREGADPG